MAKVTKMEADDGKAAATVTDETAKTVEFGSDEWGKWASGVQDRLKALEDAANASDASDEPAATADREDADKRMKRVEQMLGIK